MRRTVLLHGLVLLSTLLLAAPALAVQGASPYRHAPDARAERVSHPASQARLAQQASWQDFLDRNGFKWQAVFDEATGTPTRFWGEGIPVDPQALADDDDAWELGWQILEDNWALLGEGIEASDLSKGVLDRRAGITTLTFAQTHQGLAVEGSRISLRFKADRFVMGQFESVPGIRSGTSASLSAQSAEFLAVDALGWSDAKVVATSTPELVILPLLGERRGQATHRLAWRVELRVDALPSHRQVWIDASDGSFLAWEELIRFVSGTVLAEIDDRYPQNGLRVSPLMFAEIEASSGEGSADIEGDFSLAGDAPTTVGFSIGSEHVDIRNFAGDEVQFAQQIEAEGDTVLAIPFADSNGENRRQRAQLDVHVSFHEVRAQALAIDSSFPWAQTEAELNVNRDDTQCNAWFDSDSSINFVRQGGGCNNSGRVADIVYHEYGHGFHGWSIVEGAGAFDGALSEGLSDFMAATITGDSDMSPGFFTGGADPLREIASDKSWPEDIAEDPHYTGLIIAGALWDLRSLLVDELGSEAGVEHANHIFGQIAARASDIPSSYEEALLADDDNGNLADGTPNQCIIDDAFGRHGLGPGGGVALFFVDFDPLDEELEAETELPIALSSALSNPQCADGEVEAVRIRWSDSPSESLEDFSTLELEAAGGDDWDGVLPPVAAETYLRYQVEVLDSTGAVVNTLPSGSITDPWFASWVGPREILFEADFEADDGGFTHELLDGPDQEGADDWGWGEPGGLAGDPEEAWSGSRIWGNDIRPEENWNGAYQPNVHNILRSPRIEVGDTSSVFLQFRRWLTVEDGFWDRANVYVNGSPLWTQYASEEQGGSDLHHVDSHWAFRSYDITSLVDQDGTVEIAWDLLTDGGLELGGWNIDDVRIVTGGDWTAPEGDDDDSVTDGGPAVLHTSDLRGNGCACSAADLPSGGAGLAALGLLLGGLVMRRRRSVRP